MNVLPLRVFLIVSVWFVFSWCQCSVSMYVYSGMCLCVSIVCGSMACTDWVAQSVCVVCVCVSVCSPQGVAPVYNWVSVSLGISPVPECPAEAGGVLYLSVSVPVVFVVSL